MRTRKFMYNAAATATMQIVIMLSGLIVPKVMLVFYGSEINGLVSSISQFITYFNLVEAGLSGAAVYALYKPLADKDIYAINGVLSASKQFYIHTGYIFSLLIVMFSIVYPLYISTSVLSKFEVSLLVLVLGINGVLEFFTLAKYRVLLTADQRTYVISLSSIVQWVIYTIVVLLFSSAGFNIVMVRAVALIAIIIRTVILMVYCKIKYQGLNYKEVPNKKALDKRWDALYLQILGAVQTGAPVIILTVFLKDLKLISIYTVYNMVIGGVNSILGIFNSGLAASFGEIIAKGEKEILRQSFREFQVLFYTMTGIVFSICFVMIIPFVKVYTAGITDAEYVSVMIAFLFVFGGLVYQMKTPQGMMVIAAGLYRETRWQTTLQGTIVLVGGIVMCRYWGLSGVLFAYLLANIYRMIELVGFISKNVTMDSVKYTVKQYALMLMEGMFVIISTTRLLALDKITGYVEWGIQAFKVGICAVVAYGMGNLIFNRKEILNLVKRLKKMVNT